jgi:hypothetical protein
MSDEIHIDYESGNTLYTVVRNKAGQVWCPEGQVFENWGSNGHDADDYDITLTDKNGDRYVGDFDSNISAGRYTIQVFLQAGANPADGDDFVGSGEIIWTGTGELTADKVLANKAIQTKSTGVIDYYDDDGETVILTHTPADTESTITRTPS